MVNLKTINAKALKKIKLCYYAKAAERTTGFTLFKIALFY